VLQVGVCATGRSLIQRSPIQCVCVCVCVCEWVCECVSLSVISCNSNPLYLQWVGRGQIKYKIGGFGTEFREKYLAQGSYRFQQITYDNLYILTSFTQYSQGSSLSTLTGLWFWWMKARISIPNWGQSISNSKCPDRLWGPPRTLLNQYAYWVLFPRCYRFLNWRLTLIYCRC
jgi:hypothetical protein